LLNTTRYLRGFFIGEIMAGDWIKVEHATTDKPEVFQIAEILKIDPDAALGKCVRFWVWADQQLRDGNAENVTSVTLDRLCFCPGFAQALVDVGWLVFDGGSLLIPNHDRHLSKNAKKRAQTNRRVAQSRQGKRDCNAVNVTPVTLESEQARIPEKRREEKNINTPLPPTGGVSVDQVQNHFVDTGGEKICMVPGWPIDDERIYTEWRNIKELWKEAGGSIRQDTVEKRMLVQLGPEHWPDLDMFGFLEIIWIGANRLAGYKREVKPDYPAGSFKNWIEQHKYTQKFGDYEG